MMKLRFWLGIASGVAVALTILIAAAFFSAGINIFGVYLVVLALIGMLATWHILDHRFKILPAAIAVTVYLVCVAILVGIAIVIPAGTYDPGEHFAVLRFAFFIVSYDRNAIGSIGDAFYTGSILFYLPFFGLFMASFLSSDIVVAKSRYGIRRKVRTGPSIGFALLVAAVFATRFGYESTLSIQQIARWATLVLPWLILCVDVFVQKAGLEWSWSRKNVPIDVHWHSIGLLALLVSFYAIALPDAAYYIQNIPAGWISLLLLPLAIAVIAFVKMRMIATRGQIGRMVAVEASAAFLIATELMFITLIMSIGIQ